MTHVSFECKFKSHELIKSNIPIEIRNSNLSLIVRTANRQTVDLNPGKYYVTATLPGGQELYNRISVTTGADIKVKLYPEPEDISLHESLEIDKYISGHKIEVISDSEMGMDDEEWAKLRVYRGNIIQRKISYCYPQEHLKQSVSWAKGIAKYRVFEGNNTYIQLLQPDRVPVNFAVPISPKTSCRILLIKNKDGMVTFDVQPTNIDANTLLHFYQRNLIGYASMATSYLDKSFDVNLMKAEDLLAEKVQDPVAAAIGAYVLLRCGAINRLHDWTNNLMKWFEWLPDGIAIRAEHLAQMGKHREANDLLLKLPERGLPIFSDGLSIALDRLKQYINAKDAEFDTFIHRVKTEGLLENLSKFAKFVDFRNAVLTFVGMDALYPDRTAYVGDYAGLDSLKVIQNSKNL